MQLGPYRLIERLGAGGMGEVWKAEDTRLLRPVAIKILSKQIAQDPEWKARFLREARTAAQLSHRYVATIYAVDEDGDTMYIAMELVEGEPLSTLIGEGRVTVADAVRIVRQTAEALAAAHEKGIVHRDVKPDNVIVSGRAVKVLDFGIAKLIGPSNTDARLTQANIVLGTPFYMSPEQALGRPLDIRSDLFSLGVVLYEMLTGLKPFRGESVTETILKIVTTDAPNVAQITPSVPADLVAIVRKALSRSPSERYQTADEFALALEKASLVAPPASAKPRAGTDGETAKIVTGKTNTPPASASKPASTGSRRATGANAVPNATPPVSTARALIADDDAVTRMLLAEILRGHGVNYDEASNGADAIKQMKQHHYQLVFIDLFMPRIDGWGVLDYVRSKMNDAALKLYVVTGVRGQHLSTADQQVVSGMLYKPFDRAQVERIVQQYC